MYVNAVCLPVPCLKVVMESLGIPMTTLIKFNRLKQLTDDFSAIITALKKSEAGIVEVEEKEQKVRRSLEHPLPDASLEYWKSLKQRTVYVVWKTKPF